MNKNGVLVFLSLFCMVFLMSCMDTVNTAENKNKTMSPTFVDNKRVVTDGFLRDRLVITRIDEDTMPSGLKKVQVTFRSTRVSTWDWFWYGDDPYKISYRFTWFNKAGMVVNTPASTWIEKEVIPGDIDFIQSVAPNANCHDFILRMKEY